MNFAKRAMASLFAPVLITTLWAGLSGCGHSPVKSGGDSLSLLNQACSNTGASVRSSRGSVWLKATSKDASGQFPAVVEVPNSDQLKMEVTNLVGGTEAIISIEGQKYRIEVPSRKDRSENGDATWGGIPLQWANALFLGRVPCPDPRTLKDAQITTNGEGELTVKTVASLSTQAETFTYRFRTVEGSPWPEALRWERQMSSASSVIRVDFKFDDPEAKTRSPKKWEAKGSQGEVKVRWRDRQIEMTR